MSNWKWKGLPGHFCGSDKCIFRLCTVVGDKLVSTVGAYYPDRKKPMVEIGCDRHYETYVFNADEYGKPLSLGEIDSDGLKCTDFDDPEKFDDLAVEMHMKMCRKYDSN